MDPEPADKTDSTAGDLVAILIAEGEREERLIADLRAAVAAGDRDQVWEIASRI